MSTSAFSLKPFSLQRIPQATMFSLDSSSLALVIDATTVQMLLVGPEMLPYFKCNDAAKVLGYVKYAQAVTNHVRPRQLKTLQELLNEGVPILGTPHSPDQNDLGSRYMKESGLYRLIAKSKTKFAEAFQDWVEEEVLPSIRKKGSYSTQAATPTTKQSDTWLDKRLEGKDLMKLKNASLQQLIAGGFGQTGAKLYRIVANHINQAVLGFTETTTQFKKQRQLPQHISIPDILNMQGQVARCYAETCLQKFVNDNLQRLRGVAEPDLIKEFTQLKLNLRQGFVSTGMGDLLDKTLTLDEAKKRKADTWSQCSSRKQQRLLQTEQPQALECAV